MAVDVSGFALIAPILVFLLVFIISYVVLLKTKIVGEGKWVLAFISFIIASIFVSAGGVVELVQTVVPWMAVLLISLFFVMLFLFFMGKEVSFLQKPVGVAVIIIFTLIFLVSGFVVFNDSIVNYLPGPGYGASGDLEVLTFLDWLYSGRVAGAILLIVIGGLTAWILVRGKK